MKKDADEIFATVGLPIEGHEEIHQRVVEILGEKMSELSVAHATKSISFKKRIELYESQKNSLIEELRDFKARECQA